MIQDTELLDSIGDFRETTTLISNYVGDPALLLSDLKYDVVVSVNETKIDLSEVVGLGDLSSLVFTASDLTDAINKTFYFYSKIGETETYYDAQLDVASSGINETSSNVGDLTLLSTTDKTSMVNSINEVNLESGAVFKVEGYPSMTVLQFVNNISANQFVGSDKEDSFGLFSTQGNVLVGHIDGHKSWGFVSGVSDYFSSLVFYEDIQPFISYLDGESARIDAEIQDVEDNVNLSQAKLPHNVSSYKAYGVVSSSPVIDCSAYDIASIDCSAGATFTLSFSNFSSGRKFTLILFNATGKTINFPTGTKFPDGIKPTWGNTKIELLKVNTSIYTNLMASF